MIKQNFEDLTRGGQVRRMRRLAEIALAAYDLGEMRLTPLAHFFNTTFRVDTRSRLQRASSGDRAESREERYVIRIHRPGSQDAVTIRSELLWLLALRREAGVVVPEPVPARDGSLIARAAEAGVPEARDCVLFRWVDGRFFRSRLSVKELERVGVFMAKLHKHAENFVAPTGFFRKRWDFEGMYGGVLSIDLEQSKAHLSREAWTVLNATAESVQHTMQSLGEDREVFGLIHADFYEGNYLFSNGEVHAIDFDGCGWGYYLFDIGVTFSTLLARSNYPALRQAFLEGYRRVRALAVSHEAFIDTFIAGRLICHVLWLAAHLDEPSYGARAARRIEYETGELKKFLESSHHVI